MSATADTPDGTDAISWDRVPRDRIAYTIAEAARVLAISQSKVYMLIGDGDLKTFKVGRARRIHGAELEDFIRRTTVPGRAT